MAVPAGAVAVVARLEIDRHDVLVLLSGLVDDASGNEIASGGSAGCGND